jgi:hypothetical protein
MLTEIVTDEQLIDLYTTPGYLVAVDYPKKEVIACWLTQSAAWVLSRQRRGRTTLESSGFQKAATKQFQRQRKYPKINATRILCVPSATAKVAY